MLHGLSSLTPIVEEYKLTHLGLSGSVTLLAAAETCCMGVARKEEEMSIK